MRMHSHKYINTHTFTHTLTHMYARMHTQACAPLSKSKLNLTKNIKHGGVAKS